MQSAAISPWPYPNDFITYLVSISFSFAKLRKYGIGSAPGDKIKIIGVIDEESAKEPYINMLFY